MKGFWAILSLRDKIDHSYYSKGSGTPVEIKISAPC